MWITAAVTVLAAVGCTARPSSVYNYESASLNSQQTGTPGRAVKGGYSWTAPNGQKFSVNYIADNQGYRVVDSENLFPNTQHFPSQPKSKPVFPPPLSFSAPRIPEPTSFSAPRVPEPSFSAPREFVTSFSAPRVSEPSFSAPRVPEPSFSAPRVPKPIFNAPRVPQVPQPQTYSRSSQTSVKQQSFASQDKVALGRSHFGLPADTTEGVYKATTLRPVTVIFFTTPKTTTRVPLSTTTVAPVINKIYHPSQASKTESDSANAVEEAAVVEEESAVVEESSGTASSGAEAKSAKSVTAEEKAAPEVEEAAAGDAEAEAEGGEAGAEEEGTEGGEEEVEGGGEEGAEEEEAEGTEEEEEESGSNSEGEEW